tara:strand:- start:245 stop:793 length:549 start_codon:yes stop_codon:yes gene_type:complete
MTTEITTREEAVEQILSLLKYFKKEGLGNPFNYNRGFEFLQAEYLGFELLPVGGGSDFVSKDKKKTAEGKGTEWQGLTKKGVEKSHSWSYNGTSRFDTLEEQEEYCKKKIMRDDYHYWTVFDYEKGELVKTYKVKNVDVWSLIWTKWEKSWYNSNNKDPRIGGTVSTKELNDNNINYEVIVH